jgi:multisubunit Na+/H+ antiporter MnhF subunit
MDWNIILLIAFVVLMLVCCGSMIRMAMRPKRTKDVHDRE